MNRRHEEYLKLKEDRRCQNRFALALLGFCVGYFIIYVTVVIVASLLITGLSDVIMELLR
jgi:hypothetical protein